MCKIDDDGLFHNFAICVARMVCDESEIFFFFFYSLDTFTLLSSFSPYVIPYHNFLNKTFKYDK